MNQTRSSFQSPFWRLNDLMLKPRCWKKCRIGVSSSHLWGNMRYRHHSTSNKSVSKGYSGRTLSREWSYYNGSRVHCKKLSILGSSRRIEAIFFPSGFHSIINIKEFLIFQQLKYFRPNLIWHSSNPHSWPASGPTRIMRSNIWLSSCHHILYCTDT